jgi:hypothetical protein
LSSAAVYKSPFLHKIGEANAKTAIYKLSNGGAQRRSDAATTCYVLFSLRLKLNNAPKKLQRLNQTSSRKPNNFFA